MKRKIIIIPLVSFIILMPIALGSFFVVLERYNKIKLFESSFFKKQRYYLADFIIPQKNRNKDELNTLPEFTKAVYLTSWSASDKDNIDYIISLAKTTEINAVVIDVKDYSGYIAYNTNLDIVKKYNAEQIRIWDIGFLVERLHEQRIYTIARISVFQDPVLARARPDLAVHSKSKLESNNQELSLSTLWLDKMGLGWIDPCSLEAWDYNILIAREVEKYGFDEINFDYVRFPSDGNLSDMRFPLWDKNPIAKHLIIRNFFNYLEKNLPGIKISIDLFGLSCVNYDDLGIGQIIEDAFGNFDYVCPMVYPSHYENGFLGYQNPAQYPYQVVRKSMENALMRLKIFEQNTEKKKRDTKLRPWIQDFDLGAVYDKDMVRAEIQAVYDSLGRDFNGFMVWNSSNFYTKEAFEPVYLINFNYH